MLKHYQVFYIYLHVHLCWLVDFFFSFLVFFFSFFYKKKVVPTSNEVYFFSSVGLTLNRGGSGLTISQTIRGDNTPLDTHTHARARALAPHTGNLTRSYTCEHTTYVTSTHTHTHTLRRHDSLSHTFELRKAARTKGERDKLFVGFVSLHKHPDSKM